MDWDLEYDLAQDRAKVEHWRDVTLGETDFGLSPEPAIVGSDEWWDLIRGGSIPVQSVEGTCRPLWTSMGDYPGLEVLEPSGRKTNWTRLGDRRQYCLGRGIKLYWVEHRWKGLRPDMRRVLGDSSRVVLSVWLERGRWRLTSSFGPGPGRQLEEGWEGGPEAARD